MPEMASPEVLARIEEGWECWNDGDLDLMQDMYAEDAELDMSAAFTGMPPFKGHESMRRQWEELFETWDGLRMEPVKVHPVGDGRFVVDMRMWGRGRRSGVEVDQRLAFIYTFRREDLKVIRCQLFPTLDDAMAAAA